MDGLKRQIKQWEHAFERQHGRPPASADIKREASTRQLYRDYKALRAAPTAPATAPAAPAAPAASPPPSPQLIRASAELGPTPQAHGKVLSIFDVKVTPPQSSPLRKGEFKTPTKTARLEVTPARTPAGSPMKRSLLAQLTAVEETPRYMRPEPSTPTRPRTAFQVSPSPLKVHRGGGTMAALYREYQAIKEEAFDAESSQDDAEAPEAPEAPEGALKRKRGTQKRTTRNWKMKPKQQPAAADPLLKRDIHKVLLTLGAGAHADADAGADADADADATSDADYDSDEELLRQKQQAAATVAAQKGKVKPLSQNYQRAKINDPRAKAFKQRMRR